MLAVVAITFTVIITTLVLTKVIDIRWSTIRTVGIHIPYHTIAFVVGTPKGIPQITIRDCSVPLDDIMQRRFQLIAGLVVGVVVVAVGNLGNANEADR